MVEYTEEQYRAAARRAAAAGDIESARSLIAKGQALSAQPGEGYTFPELSAMTQNPQVAEPQRGFMDAVKDNIIGVDDGVMSPGEKLGTLLNIGGEGMTLGVVGDEAAAGFDAAIGRGGSFQENLQKYRQDEAQVRSENPILSFGADIGGALLPGAAGVRAIQGAKTFGGRVLSGGLLGAAGGATYGFMEGDETANGRIGNAALTGLLGGVLGGAAEPVARGVGALARNFGGGAARAARGAMNTLDIDRTGADIVGSALERDASVAAGNYARAGQDGVVAMAGPNTRGLLDWAVNRPGTAAANTGRQLQELAGNAGKKFSAALDNALGESDGITRLQSQMMKDTAESRRAAYNAAYSQPIDYRNAGNLENLLGRVPADVVRRAERLMATEGAESAQKIARIADDGTVTFDTLPDVRQIDYITRALRDMGDFGVGEGKEQGRAYMNLASNLRRSLDDVVPEYKAARAAGGDVIANREALEFGSNLMARRIPLDVAEDTIGLMTEAELKNARLGVRRFFTEKMDNVEAALTDNNMDAREAITSLKRLTSRDGRQRIEALLGDEAQSFLKTADEAFEAISLRASAAQNSKTAIRQQSEGILSDSMKPSFGDALIEGKGVMGAVAQAAAPILSEPALQRAARSDAVMNRVGQLLMSPSGGRLSPILQNLAPVLRAGDEFASSAADKGRLAMGLLASGALSQQARQGQPR